MACHILYKHLFSHKIFGINYSVGGFSGFKAFAKI